MIYAIAFLVGATLGAIIVAGFMLSVRREVDRRMGYLDLTRLSSSHEGRDASAEPRSSELSRGGDVTPPPYLRLIRDGGSSEVVIPLDNEGRTK
jgi:hypothetical protein